MKSVKNTVKSDKSVKSAANVAKAAETVQAVSYVLDVKQNHSMRQSACDKLAVDLFALHAEKQVSRAYVKTCAENAEKAKSATHGKEASHVIVCGGVANKVALAKDGFYARKSGETVVVGNVELLAKLYGKRFECFTLKELGERFTAQKEQVTRRIGTSKTARLITGREIASADDKFVLCVKQENGTLALFNGEYGRNVHNSGVRASDVKTTTAKAETVAK